MKINILVVIIVFLGFSISISGLMAQQAEPKTSGWKQLFENNLEDSEQQTDRDSLITWQEQILLHLDKSVCNPGDPLFFKAYTLTGPNRVRATLSKVLKMELLDSDNQIVSTQYHKIEDGMTSGTFEVSKKLKEGTYTLQAYTRWMQNYGPESYFSTDLTVGEIEDNTGAEPEIAYRQVNFFPESGYLVNGLQNRLYLKSLNREGKPLELEGTIVSTNGEAYPITSFGNGVASVLFTPSSGRQYQLKTRDGATYELPVIQPNGYLVQANNLDAEWLRIRIQANQTRSGSPLWVTGYLNGIAYFRQEVLLEDNSCQFEIAKEAFPSGTMKIALEDALGNIMASRPVLIERKEQLNIRIQPLEFAGGEDSRRFKVMVSDAQGKPMQTSFSLSAVSLTGILTISGWDNDFLQQAGWSPERKKRFERDIQVLISGGTDVQNIVPKQQIKYPFQKGLDLFGYAYDLNNNLLKNTKIQVLSTQSEELTLKEVQTDATGLLRLEGLDIVGDTELVFRTEGESTESRLVKLKPIQQKSATEKTSGGTQKESAAIVDTNPRPGIATRPSPWEPFKADNLIELEPVEVSDKKTERKRPIEPTYGLEATGKRYAIQDNEKPKFVWQLFNQIPGVSMSENSLAFTGSLASATNSPGGRGDTPFLSSALDAPGPLWVIDGFIVGNSPGLDPTWGITMLNIDRIEVLRPAEGAIYGSRAGEGVILLYTRNGSEFDYTNRKEGGLLFQGYHQSEGFESYAEQLSKKPRRYEGRPATLFWNPDLQTDANGEAIVEIDSPVALEQLEIKVSTVTETGAIGSTRLVFKP
ncbi:TonB-dependent receptor [Robiginitalea sp. IMCC43444]|uniref:TonB-dependent receptor n=1 Tax=Robiginitalea sp. IMCC43444 TaxID=3459121 RepID=UPI0040427B4C